MLTLHNYRESIKVYLDFHCIYFLSKNYSLAWVPTTGPSPMALATCPSISLPLVAVDKLVTHYELLVMMCHLVWLYEYFYVSVSVRGTV